MYWIITPNADGELPAVHGRAMHGRFVLHRHYDADGPHLDLRFEQDGYLSGFRIDALSLDSEILATEKGAHPLAWLERDGDAFREDSGTYQRHLVGDSEMYIALYGVQGTRVLHAVRESGLPPGIVRAVCIALRTHNTPVTAAAALIADGVVARRRAVERLCGLARELDGAAFDEAVCLRGLSPLSLEDIHAQLRAYEKRFDAAYPPAPVSRPETLCGGREAQRGADALAIVQSEGRR